MNLDDLITKIASGIEELRNRVRQLELRESGTGGTPGGTTEWFDEGVSQGEASAADIVGDGASVSVAGGIATITVSGKIHIQDEGSAQGDADTLNVTGTNAAISVAGDVATLAITTPPGPTEGPGIDLVGTQVGVGLDSILLSHGDQAPATEYSCNEAGLQAAVAAAVSGDVIILPACSIDIDISGQITGAFNVRASNGVEISGIPTGAPVTLENTGGPWNGGHGLYYFWEASDDGGGVWDNIYTVEPPTPLRVPAWATSNVMVDEHHNRLTFTPTHTTLRVRVEDSIYGDNGGAMGYLLSYGGGGITIPAGVEIVGLGENSVLDGNVINNGILTNLKVTGTITGSGTCRMVSNPDNQVFTRVIESKVLTGTAPLDVASDTLVLNLNTDMLDGYHADDLPPIDHDHSGDAGDGGTFDAANLTSGTATDGQVLTADGAGGAAWENGGARYASDLLTRYEPLVFDDAVLIFNHDVVMVEVAN